MDIFDFNRCIISDRNGTYGGDSGHKEGVLINKLYYHPKTESDTTLFWYD